MSVDTIESQAEILRALGFDVTTHEVDLGSCRALTTKVHDGDERTVYAIGSVTSAGEPLSEAEQIAKLKILIEGIKIGMERQADESRKSLRELYNSFKVLTYHDIVKDVFAGRELDGGEQVGLI